MSKGRWGVHDSQFRRRQILGPQLGVGVFLRRSFQLTMDILAILSSGNIGKLEVGHGDLLDAGPVAVPLVMTSRDRMTAGRP